MSAARGSNKQASRAFSLCSRLWLLKQPTSHQPKVELWHRLGEPKTSCVPPLLRCRPSASSSAAVCLPEELSGVWSAASYLVALVVSSLEWRIANDANPHYWEPEPLLTALEHAIHALREASAAWQWCHSSSGSSSAAFQVHLDAREWLPELCCNLAMLATVLQEKLLEENEEQRQPAIWSRDSAAAVMNVLALALEVEVGYGHGRQPSDCTASLAWQWSLPLLQGVAPPNP